MRHQQSIDSRTYQDVVNVAKASGSDTDKDLMELCKDINLAIRKDPNPEVVLSVTDSFGTEVYATFNLG